MQGLKRLGMTDHKLNMDDLRDRASSIKTLSEHKDYKVALERFEHLHHYIYSVYSTKQNYVQHELRKLSDIPFLPVEPEPVDCDVPWKGNAKSFYSPADVYLSEHRDLIFTQHPIVSDKVSSEFCNYLQVSSNEPSVEDVISNLKCLIQHIKDMPELSEQTTAFLDDCIRSMYRYLEGCLTPDKKETIMRLLKDLKLIWQNGKFLGLNQVVLHWNHDCFPYVCELLSTNKNYSKLVTALGIKQEMNVTMMVETLKRIATDHNTEPISSEVLEFVVYTSGQLNKKFSLTSEQHSYEIYLPDEYRVMRLASDMADKNVSELIKRLSLFQDYERHGCYVHKDIPYDCAKNLGVNALLDAVFEVIEDKNFMQGADFGQHEDLCDRLDNLLKKYPADISIFKEFIQNAEDAKATEIMFILDRRTNFPDDCLLNSSSKWKSLQNTPALCVYNNKKLTKNDIEGIAKLGRGGKDSSTDQIGKFGIGFNVAYHVTDCPSFVSYSESGSPEHLCVFDPTRSFVCNYSKKQSPGRKWDFEDKLDCSNFPNQFKPYLSDDLSLLFEYMSSCFSHKEKEGFVVFRLPFTRLNSPVDTPQKLSRGCTLSPQDISKLFEEFKSISQDVLLFLEHLRSVSAFEILNNNLFKHHFTATATILQLNDYRYFTQSVNNYRDFAESLEQPSTMVEQFYNKYTSVGYKMEITIHCIQPDSNECKEEKSEWLLQRVIGGSDLSYDLLRAGLSQGLLPVGGVATQLKPLTVDRNYHFFCFLPLPLESYLPVHVNGHFLVDDSRKHLETLKHIHVSLAHWNEFIARKVIVHAYIDLIKTVKDLVDKDSGTTPKFYCNIENAM